LQDAKYNSSAKAYHDGKETRGITRGFPVEEEMRTDDVGSAISEKNLTKV